MNIRFHKNFEKRYKGLPKKKKEKLKEKVSVFLKDEFDPILNNHSLKGKHAGYRSINVAGDLRAIYKRETNNRIIFVTIDIHSNLYK